MNNSKKQLKKWQKALIGVGTSIGAVLLMFVVLFVGIMIKYNTPSNDSDNSNSVEETAVEEPKADDAMKALYSQRIQNSIPDGPDDAVDMDTTPILFKLSDSGLNEFIKCIASIEVNYDFEGAYNIDEALALYNDNTVNSVAQHSHDIRLNGEFDADHFYEIVKENNKRFLEDDDNAFVLSFYEEYSDSQLKKICKQMMEALPAIAEKDPAVDLDTVCCYLYNLKIMKKGVSFDFAGFDMDSRFYMNYDMLDATGQFMDSDDVEKTTFYHEMMHAFQFACDDIKKPDEDRMGITHTYGELEINPLSWYWLLEGSAEMNMSQYLGVRYSTYKNMITYIDTLNFISNLGTNDALVQTEKLCFQRDLEKFFEQLDMTGEPERRELIKMMFSIEIIQKDDEEFCDWYEEKYNVDLSTTSNGEQTYLRLTVKEDALLTMTKMFYRNLAKQINTGNATLQDVYYLMRIWEADLDRHFSNNTIGYMEFFHNFYDTYIELQDKFFEIIANENDLSADEIKDNFDSYSMNATDKSPNCDLNFLNAESKNYITKTFVDSFYKKGYPSMRSCQKQATELNEKYPIEDMIVNRVLL